MILSSRSKKKKAISYRKKVLVLDISSTHVNEDWLKSRRKKEEANKGK